MAHPLIALKDVRYLYDGRVIIDVGELSVREGEILVVLGPTGSGKSTLLRLINLLERPDQGMIAWRGEPLDGKGTLAVRRKIAMAFQDPLLFNRSVSSNVAYGLKLRHLSRAEIEERAHEILKVFSIEHLARRPAGKISGGEAQRVALARALVLKPELLLLDEPLASLDPQTKDRLALELHQILKRLNVTTVCVTHSREEAFSLADRIGILDGGRLLQIGTPEEVFYKPATVEVASFVGTENVLPGRVTRQNQGLATVDVDGRDIEAVAVFGVGQTVTVCIRPEEIILTKHKEKEAASDIRHPTSDSIESARNHFGGRVRKMDALGPIAKVVLDCGFPLVATVTRRSASDLDLSAGQDVVASFKATAVHVIRHD